MNKVLVLCIVCLSLFASCKNGIAQDNLLEQIESVMEAYLDSALTLLKTIEHPEVLKGKEQADYALLLTQAYDKMYMDSLQSDSLIELATKYYSGQKEGRVKAGKAFYYYGKVVLLGKRYTKAMQAYLEAQTYLEGTADYKMQGLVWEYIGYLNSIQDDYNYSINHFKKSIECYKLADDESGVLHGYKNIARDYLAMHNNDSACWYANKGLALSDSSHDFRLSFLQILGYIANEKKQYSQAADYFMYALENSHKLSKKYRYSLSLGNTYWEMGQEKKAIGCFNYSKNSTNVFISFGSYFGLSKIYKHQADYKKAMECKEKSDSLLEIVRNNELQIKILDLQSKYKNEKLILENEQMKLMKEKHMFFYLFLLTLTVGVGIVVFVYLRKKYQKLVLHDMEIIRNNNQTIEKYACRIADLESANEHDVESKNQEISHLNRKLLCLTTENRRIRENTSVDALFVLDELKQGKLIIENMTVTEREHIFDFMNLIYANFVTRIQESFKLSKSELLLAVLLKVGFSNKQVANVFDCEMKSIYKYRQRLKQSLMLDKEESLDQMIMFY